ncbi:MAG TPA: DUF72 domain-containing protein [Planctomycetota bacterium]|nr:DUF72 domain-containing protein [Planctomycetota bacterium]
MPRARILIGISGWRYAPWRGVFYPKGLPQKQELAYASRTLPSIELNGSFYSLQRPSSYERWGRETPDEFVFSVKGSRYITHLLRLKEVEPALARFFGSGLLNLGAKLGPILWQFPPNFKFDAERFENFLRMLPKDASEAAALAERHHALQKGAGPPAGGTSRRLRYAVEIRHESFRNREFIRMLRENGIALVVADTAGKWPYLEEPTADFMYLRLHGDVELYASGYTDAALDRWAERIRAWRAGGEPKDARRVTERPAPRRKPRDVYCYFDNDAKVKAPFDAKTLLGKLGQSPKRRRM